MKKLVIFLDIDGVISFGASCNLASVLFYNKDEMLDSFYHKLDSLACSNLRTFYSELERLQIPVVTVIASSFVKIYGLDNIMEVLTLIIPNINIEGQLPQLPRANKGIEEYRFDCILEYLKYSYNERVAHFIIDDIDFSQLLINRSYEFEGSDLLQLQVCQVNDRSGINAEIQNGFSDDILQLHLDYINTIV